MARPVSRLPDPARPGVRRETSLVISPRGEWTAGATVAGRVRDVVRTTGDVATTAAGATMAVDTDGAGTLLAVDLPEAVAAAAALLGRGIRGGFRAALASAPGLDATSPAAALLDDLPAVQLISGYALMMEGLVPPAPRIERESDALPLLGVCSGWRPDGVAVERSRAQVRLLGDAAPVPPFAAIAGGSGPDEEPLRPRTMRRRRFLEVTPATGGWTVSAYLRDSHVAADGIERGLHEYVVAASATGEDLVLDDVVAEPRTLPFADCPLAAPQVTRLSGLRAAEAGRGVLDRLPGTFGCTHLNDLLRTFRALPALTSLLSAALQANPTDRGDRP
jgi:hypothetical protein